MRGNIMATVESSDDTIVMTIRATAFEHSGDGGSATSRGVVFTHT